MSKYTYIILALVIVAIGAGVWLKFKPESRPDSFIQDNMTLVFADKEMMACSQDSDCIIVPSDCNECSAVQIINKSFKGEFERKKERICRETEANEPTSNRCVNMIKGVKCNEQGVCIGF